MFLWVGERAQAQWSSGGTWSSGVVEISTMVGRGRWWQLGDVRIFDRWQSGGLPAGATDRQKMSMSWGG